MNPLHLIHSSFLHLTYLFTSLTHEFSPPNLLILSSPYSSFLLIHSWLLPTSFTHLISTLLIFPPHSLRTRPHLINSSFHHLTHLFTSFTHESSPPHSLILSPSYSSFHLTHSWILPTSFTHPFSTLLIFSPHSLRTPPHLIHSLFLHLTHLFHIIHSWILVFSMSLTQPLPPHNGMFCAHSGVYFNKIWLVLFTLKFTSECEWKIIRINNWWVLKYINMF